MSKKIKVEMSNCFGIGELNHEFDFSNCNVNVVYAPNGVMKTSFSKACKLYSAGKSPKDQIYPHRESICQILDESDNEVNPNEILVIESEDDEYDSSKSVSAFLANNELKGKYDQILAEIDGKFQLLITKLKLYAKSTDVKKELTQAFVHDDKTTIMRALYDLYKEVSENKYSQYTFKYNSIYDKDNRVGGFISENYDDFVQYSATYKALLDKSSFFNSDSTSTFGTHEASSLYKVVEDGYFQANHKLTLSDETQIENKESLQEIIRTEIEKVLENPELKDLFKRINKKLDSHTILRTFQDEINQHKELVDKLSDYEGFRLEVLKSYLKQAIDVYKDFYECYKAHESELKSILSLAAKDIDAWKEVIEIFNNRFEVPFIVGLKNQQDILLRSESASLEFMFKDSDENAVVQDKKTLTSVLSRGEKRALYILQVLFELEARKAEGQESIIIFDDVADSFDYRNKYAILEYLQEYKDNSGFKLLLLTHNFDFYRLVANRLGVSRTEIFMATKEPDTRKVCLQQGEYTKVLIKTLISGAHKDPKKFIALVPFVRNLVEYTAGEDERYLQLTNCLHIKESTHNLLISNISDTYKNVIPKFKSEAIEDELLNLNFVETLYDLCDKIAADEGESYLIENKLILSMGIRLKSEEFMLDKTSLSHEDLKDKKFQTRVLYNNFKDETDAPANEIAIMSKTCLMTPENIHVNSFMYEPIIDMSNNHLISLYNDVKALLPDS